MWNCGPGTDLRSRYPLLTMRGTSDPILRTAGPPAHTHESTRAVHGSTIAALARWRNHFRRAGDTRQGRRAGSSALEGRGWPQVLLVDRSTRESERVLGGHRRSPPSDLLIELGEPTRSQVEPATTLSASLQ